MARLDEIRERLREIPDPLEFLVSLFSLSPVPHIIYDANGDCVLANDAVRKLYGGLPPPGFNVFRDEETQRTGIIPQIRRAFAGETVEIPPHWYDAREVGPDEGRRVAVASTVLPLRNAAGEVTHVAVAFKDLTEQFLAREAAERERDVAERFAAVLDVFIDSAPVQFGIVDASLRFVKVNPALAMGNGHPIEAHLGRSIYELLPRVAEVVAPLMQQVLDSGQPVLNFHASIEPRATPGLFRHAHISLFPIELPGRDDRMVGIVVAEITDQVRARETIENQQKWLDAVLNLMPTPVVMVEPGTGRYILTNQAADDLYAKLFQANEGGEISTEDVVVTDAEGRLLGPDQLLSARAARGEEFNAEEMRWQTPGGDFDLLLFARQLPAMYGHPAAVIAPFQDITRLKKVERDLKEAVRTRDAFLSIASHELKTPLTSMKLNLQGTRRHIERGREGALNADRIARVLEQSDRQIDRLTRLVDDMLDVSRLTTGKLAVHRELFDLAHLAREVIDRLYPVLEKAHCPVTLDAPEVVQGEWDLSRLEQVLVNLLTNAARYGAGRPIEVEVRREGEHATLSVRDHGRGIAPEDQGRIFEQFERAVSAREISGLGLGLYISKQIVTMHGGTIGVESRPGEGARFTIRLPLSES